MSTKLVELFELVGLWSDDVGLTEKGTPIKQAEKGVEEAQEYLEACIEGDRDKKVDELGDKFVTSIVDCKINDIKPEEALLSAYQKIVGRIGSGKLVNGTFVKKEDL